MRTAEVELTRLGAVSRIEYEFSEEIAADHLIRTIPAAGDTVSAGETVTLYVSLGKELALVPVPPLTGMEQDAAAALLEQAGLTMIATPVDSDKPKGEVLSQSPEAGGEAEEGSAVTVEVSNGAQAPLEKEITVSFPMAPDVVTLVIRQDGEVVHEKQYETRQRSVRLMLRGRGLQIVEVYINGVLQESGYVDFDA